MEGSHKRTASIGVCLSLFLLICFSVQSSAFVPTRGQHTSSLEHSRVGNAESRAEEYTQTNIAGATCISISALAVGAAVGAANALARARKLRPNSVATRALPDGTNDEGEDLKEPLILTLSELKDVKMYGQDGSPPCAKLKTMLDYYNVPFEMIKGRHPTSDYKRIPVLELNGRQINDSHIIVKNLVPVLTGEPISAAAAEWERRITFEFQPSIEVELFGNGGDLALFIGLEGFAAIAIKLLAPVLGLLINQVFKSRYGEFPPSVAWGKDFLAALDGQPFYHGDAPGPVDLSLYGTYAALQAKGCKTTEDFLVGSGLKAWHERMAAACESKTAVAA